jgi:uncharacterized protein YutE (UPF0331/DUF86 family)
VTDRDLIAKKLALIETCIRELKTLSRPSEIPRGRVQERFAEHTLQIAIQAAIVDVAIVKDIVEHRLDDLQSFVTLIRSKLA